MIQLILAAVGGYFLADGFTGESEKLNSGGYLVGKRHSEGGIKAKVKSTNQDIEMEGGEVVITRGAVSSPKKYNFEGKEMTSREILSDINVKGGGVAFKEGGKVEDKAEEKAMELFELNNFLNTSTGQSYAKRSALVAANVGLEENLNNPKKKKEWQEVISRIKKIEV